MSGYTTVPNVLLDTAMCELLDSELRVLLVVIRQTLGWHKEQEWISQGWFKDKTGRSSASVSHGIDSLVRRGLIVVTDDKGRVLATSRDRQVFKGRCYFALAPELIELTFPGGLPQGNEDSELQNLNDITAAEEKKEIYRKTTGDSRFKPLREAKLRTGLRPVREIVSLERMLLQDEADRERRSDG